MSVTLDLPAWNPKMHQFLPRFAGAVAVLAACASLQGATISRQHAEAFERKVGQINAGRSPATPLRTPVSEDEINSWFAYRAQSSLPEGITNPKVTMIGSGRVSGQATVDLDAVGKRRSSGGWLDPWALLAGRLPIGVTGTLQAKDGKGQFSLESATLGGVPMPKFMLQELLSLYSRSPERPRGMSLDDPFPLPANIRQIEVGRGEAVVVQ